MKIKKISLSNWSEFLTDNEMKATRGGYSGYGGYNWNECKTCTYTYFWSDGYSKSYSGVFCGGIEAHKEWGLNEIIKNNADNFSPRMSQVEVAC